MITLEMCLEYLKHPKGDWIFKDTYPSWVQPPIILTEAQEKFLSNLCEGKITDRKLPDSGTWYPGYTVGLSLGKLYHIESRLGLGA